MRLSCLVFVLSETQSPKRAHRGPKSRGGMHTSRRGTRSRKGERSGVYYTVEHEGMRSRDGGRKDVKLLGGK